MVHSVAEYLSLICPQCGQPFTAEVWLVINSDERPDLLARVSDGTIHHVACPRQHRRPLTLPLLLLWGDVLVVSFSESATRQEDQEVEAAWLHELGAKAGIDWQQEAQADRVRFIERPKLIERLSGALRAVAQTNWLAQYDRTGSLADLDTAITMAEAALRNGPAEPARQAAQSHHLGVAYHERHTRLKQRGDLVRAGLHCAIAVELTPKDDPTRATRLLDLGLVTRERYLLSRNLDDLDQAISVLEDARRQTTEPTGKGASIVIHNLAACHSDYYDHIGEPAHLDRAIGLYRQALDDHSQRALSLHSLSHNLHRRYKRLGQSADRDEALALARQAARQAQTDSPAGVLWVARAWATLALEQGLWAEVLTAADLSRETLRRLDEANPLVEERMAWRRGAQGLVAAEAYALARRGDPRAAVVALEAGQALQLNANLPRGRDRALLAQLAAEAPSLFAEFRVAAEALWSAQHNGLDILDPWSGRPDSLADARARAAAAQTALDQVVERVNARPGYETLFTPTTFDDVAAAVDQAPLVYLVTTAAGSLALLLYRVGAEVMVEPVWAALTADELQRLLIRREYAAGNVGKLVGGFWRAQAVGATMMRDELELVLPVAYARLMAPLAARLRALGAKAVTLIPGGPLALLPLHAAHPPDDPSAAFLDEFTVAYAPSAQAITHCRAAGAEWAPTPPAERPALVVGNPLPTTSPLLHARAEAEAVATRLATTPLLDEAATREAVWPALWGKALIHFAGHAIFDPDRPRASGLVLADAHRLTLRDIGDAAVLSAPLVVLSACQTGLTAAFDLPDEALGLPAGLLGAGAAGVITTLWPIDDPAVRLLVERFYTALLDEGLAPAQALRAAQRHLRDLPRQTISDYFRERWDLGEDWAEAAHVRLPAGARPYSHPYYWAAYTFTGAIS